MSISVYPRAGSQSGKLGYGGKESYTAGYVVQGTTDCGLAVEAVLQTSPPAVVAKNSLLIRQPLSVKELGGSSWHVDAEYAPAEEKDDDDDDQATALAFKISWDTTGGTVKITESREVIAASFGEVDKISPAIGWDGKKVNGCDIVAPQLRLTIDVFYQPAFITAETVKNWARATGKVNKDPWLTFAAGELLLMGCSGEQTFSMLNGRATKPVPVSFKLDCSENNPGPLPGGLNGGKDGWDYLDVYYGEKTVGDGDNKITIAFAERAKVHRVYLRTSFRDVMGIG